ncbi:carboxypeptidase-like regulatory domain-containing protein [Algoriphagus namhaensis]
MKRIIFSALGCLLALYSFGQKISLSGTVRDAGSGESLIGVNIFDPKAGKGAVTNNYGFFSYSVFEPQVDLIISYVGYESLKLSLTLERDTVLNLELEQAGLLGEVVVQGERSDPIQESTSMGLVNVSIREIKNIPALMGEVDIFKVLQLLPGVQSGAEYRQTCSIELYTCRKENKDKQRIFLL